MTAAPTKGAQGLSRIAFWVYAAILFTGTHWPKLQAPGPEGTDKWIHAVCFGTWAALLIGAGFFGAPLNRRNVLISLLIAPAYAAADEGLQAIPFVHRSAEFADYFANLKGIGLVGAVAIVLTMRRPRTTQTAADEGMPSSPA